MIARPVPATLTVEEYFAIESVENERRFEYIDGEIKDKTGGTNNHSVIKLNIAFELERQLRKSKSDCSLRNSDMRVKIGDFDGVIPIEILGCQLPLSEVYAGISFDSD